MSEPTSLGGYLDSLDPAELLDLAIERTKRKLRQLEDLRELMDARIDFQARVPIAPPQPPLPKIDEPPPITTPVAMKIIDRIIITLGRGGPLTAGEVAVHAGCSKASIYNAARESNAIRQVTFKPRRAMFELTDSGRVEYQRLEALLKEKASG